MEINYVKKAFSLIENNLDESSFTGGVSLNTIKKVEDILNVTLPESYKSFLFRYGVGDIFGIEIYGIISDENFEGTSIPSLVWITKDFRKKFTIPFHFIPISYTGYGPYYFIDTENSKVALWDFENKPKYEFSDFGKFLFVLLNEQLD